MENKNNMMCDLETGICGPAGENVNTNIMELIDFSMPNETVNPKTLPDSNQLLQKELPLFREVEK